MSKKKLILPFIKKKRGRKNLQHGPIIFKYSLKILMRHSFHFFGFRHQIHPHLYNYILGFYFNIALVNLNYSIIFLRKATFLLKNLLFSRARVLIVDESFYNSLISKYFNNKYYYYIFCHWTKGILSNMIERRKQNLKETIFSYVKTYPGLVFIVNSREDSGRSILNELYRVKLPVLKVVGGADDLSYLTWWNFSNPVSIKTRRFYLKYLKKVCDKIEWMTKKHYHLMYKRAVRNKMRYKEDKVFHKSAPLVGEGSSSLRSSKNLIVRQTKHLLNLKIKNHS